MNKVVARQCILRVFEVRAKPGCREQLEAKLGQTSVAVVDGMPGNLGYLFGNSLSSNECDLVFISIWTDLAAVRAHFGEDWESSYLPPGYETLIETCSIKHMAVTGKFPTITAEP